MFKRKPKKQNKILRLILRLLGVYAVERDNFNLVNPSINNEGKSTFIFNKKSFVFPNGYVDLKRKVKSLDIVLRYCTTVNLWKTSQTWKRIIPDINKEDLVMTCFKSLLSSINQLKKNQGKKLKITLHLIDDGHIEIFNKKILSLSNKLNIETKYYKNENQGNKESFLKSLNLSKNFDDLIFFVEDDYLFEENAIEECILSYSRLASLLNEDIIITPTDYSFYYDSLYKTSVMLGANYKFRFVGETLMTFLISKEIIEKNFKIIEKVSTYENYPFEKPLHELYTKHPCLAPIGSLSYHISTIAPGTTPHSNWKKTWDKYFLK
jgi:hypothetical protein